MIRVVLPPQLQTLAHLGPELRLDIEGCVTQHAVIDAIEKHAPALYGTLRDPATMERRPRVRFFAAREDLSHVAPTEPLPDEIVSGAEPLLIVGAISGG